MESKNNFQNSDFLEAFASSFAPVVREVLEEQFDKVYKTKKFEESEFINSEEACQILNVKQSTLYNLTSQRKIPFYKRGKNIYFKRNELFNYISAGKVYTKREGQLQAQKHLNSMRGGAR